MKKFFSQFLVLFFFTSIALEAGINDYNISQEDKDQVIKELAHMIRMN